MGRNAVGVATRPLARFGCWYVIPQQQRGGASRPIRRNAVGVATRPLARLGY